jgi:hypothetical protein
MYSVVQGDTKTTDRFCQKKKKIAVAMNREDWEVK